MSLDISYRDTGVAIIDRSVTEPDLTTVRLSSIKSPELGNVGFKSLEQASIWINETLNEINNIIFLHIPDIVIIEMPAYTQSSKAALAIGMCWGIVQSIQCDKILIVEPSLLKNWSSSKRGDKKTKVKERVLERLEAALGSKASNDNIVDAAGLCLAASDLLSYEIIQTNKQNADSGAFNLKG